MARTQALLNTGVIATGTSAKTILQAVAASNQRCTIVYWSIGFAGTTATNAPVLVQLVRQSDAGTTSALTPTKGDDSLAESLTTTARHTATVEPTTGDVVFTIYVHPQGRYESQVPRFIGGGDRMAIRVTAANDVNCVCHMTVEE